MLNSPTADQGGYCDLFSAPELRQLASREPKLINKIAEANTAICTIDTFLSAYAKITPGQLQSLKSIIEVKKHYARVWNEIRLQPNLPELQ